MKNSPHVIAVSLVASCVSLKLHWASLDSWVLFSQHFNGHSINVIKFCVSSYLACFIFHVSTLKVFFFWRKNSLINPLSVEQNRRSIETAITLLIFFFCCCSLPPSSHLASAVEFSIHFYLWTYIQWKDLRDANSSKHITGKFVCNQYWI